MAAVGLERFIKIGLRILAADDSCHPEMIGLYVGGKITKAFESSWLFHMFTSRGYIC